MILQYTLLTDSNGFKGIAPQQMTKGSVCFDLALPHTVPIFPGQIVTVPLLIAFDIPEPYYIEVYPRSSLQTKYGIISSTSIIDTDYKKTIHAILYNTVSQKVFLQEGQRVMQFVIKKKEDVYLEQVDYIKDTDRGGLGSTNDK